LDTLGQAAGNDIADGGRRFNWRNADLSNEGPIPDHKHFGLGLDRRGGHRGSARQSCVGLIDRQHPKNGGEQQQ
jgi:hypothetical protein